MLPCPFCGGEPVNVRVLTTRYFMSGNQTQKEERFAECLDCHIRTPTLRTQIEVTNRWENRK